MNSIYDDLIGFIGRHHEGKLGPDENLFMAGALDSLMITELIVFIEETFGVNVEPDDLTMDNLSTLRSIARLIDKYRDAKVHSD